MDFNIVTFHSAYNYGAILQSLALQEFIISLGYNAGIFDYRPNVKQNYSGIRGKILYVLNKIHKDEFALRNSRFDAFIQENLLLNLEKESRIFLSGSDQVWNPTGSMNPIYFLQFVGDTSVRASYAASMGKTIVPNKKKDLFKRYINHFDIISVREQTVKDCLKEFCDKPISVNVDPTLLMDCNFWEKYMKPVSGLPEKYILVYVLHLPNNVNKVLKWLTKETGNKVVLIDGQGVLSFIVKNDISLHNIGPAEFLWLVANAQSVVTSSFHGTAFSIIFHKEFYSIVNPASPSRINNILNLFNLKGTKETDSVFLRNNCIDWAEVERIRTNEKNRSAAYLKDVYDLSCTEYRKIEPHQTVEVVQEKCTGCSACFNVCPVNAITMEINKQGFLYPDINSDKCVRCSKCLKACPLGKKQGNLKKKSYYGWNKSSDIRFNSSSGGIFRGLADSVINEGGVVFGAVFSSDYRSVVFSDSDHSSLEQIQKSKYTVSMPGDIYKKVKSELLRGRKVLFCGTPCQNAGLTHFLEKDYPNLIKCDFVCGGMASLAFYKEHLEALQKKYNSEIASVDFRPKQKGWGKQRLLIKFKNGKTYFERSHKDLYFKCFANTHVSVRKTCLDCEFFTFHYSDISLADFWGYKSAGVRKNKEGLSLVVANTEKGIDVIEKCSNLELFKMDNKFSDYAFRAKSPNLDKIKQQEEFFKETDLIGFEATAKKLYPISERKHIEEYIKTKLKIK